MTRPQPSPTKSSAIRGEPPCVDPSCSEQLRRSERLASLGILAAGVAHEIMNPLASVLAGVEALRRRLGAVPEPVLRSAEVVRILDTLEKETNRARAITDRMMLLARSDPELPAWLDLNQVVEDSLGLLRYPMMMQKIESRLELDPGLSPVWARGGGLRSVCMNLFLNAVQAMPQGGSLTVRTHGDGSRVSVEVEDTGPGIPPHLVHRIWDPFYTTKPPGMGTGLGISISRAAVEQHGGSIEVRNIAPHGALFTVKLPMGTGR